MTAFPHADVREAVRDLQELTLRPEDAPDDADLESSPWTVTDEESAAWALTKVRAAVEAARRRNEPARLLIAEHEAAIAELQSTVEANEARAQSTVDWFTIHLTRWHREQYDADPDPKHRHTTSIDLPGGVLVSRKTTGKVLAVADPESLPEALRQVEYRPKKREITAHIKETGEIPVGVSWEKPYRRYEVDY